MVKFLPFKTLSDWNQSIPLTHSFLSEYMCYERGKQNRNWKKNVFNKQLLHEIVKTDYLLLHEYSQISSADPP